MAKITTKVGTLSYPNLFTPNGFAGQDPKFSTILIFDESEDLSKLEEAIEAALVKKFGEVPSNYASPIKNGDDKKDKDGNPRPEYAGRMYITVKNKADKPPYIVGADVQPILNESEIYGGCKARVSINVSAYDFMGTKGVSLWLQGVQKTSDGEPFGQASRPEDDFTPF